MPDHAGGGVKVGEVDPGVVLEVRDQAQLALGLVRRLDAVDDEEDRHPGRERPGGDAQCLATVRLGALVRAFAFELHGRIAHLIQESIKCPFSGASRWPNRRANMDVNAPSG